MKRSKRSHLQAKGGDEASDCPPTPQTVCKFVPQASWYEPEDTKWLVTLTDNNNAPFTSDSSVVVKLEMTVEQLRELHATLEEALHYAVIDAA